MDLEKKAVELKSNNTPYCMVTVVRVEGSAPRHAGAKMIVTSRESLGTIGGGALEHTAIEDARLTLRHREAICKKYDLTEGEIQPCGGSVELFFQPEHPPKPVYVFGAGHIAEKLCPMLAELGFDITLIDERSERIDLPTFSDIEKRINELPKDFLPTIKFDEDTHIICLTHKHLHDEEIIEFCLDKPLRYLGLISSRKKWALFSEHYREKGFTDEQLARVSTPIGLDIGAESPFEIAVAIVGELIGLHSTKGAK